MALFFLSDAWTGRVAYSRDDLERSLRQDLTRHLARPHGVSFGHLLKTWELRFGPSAAMSLLSIAQDRSLQDEQRFIALLSAAKLGGHGVVGEVAEFLEDSSWMLRMGALRALRVLLSSELPSPSLTRAILKRLKDPGLVVRSEAIETVEKLQLRGAAAASSEQDLHRSKGLRKSFE